MDSIDLFDPDIQENWFPAYKTLLEEAPVYRIPGSTTFVITKYEDILTIVGAICNIFRRGQKKQK